MGDIQDYRNICNFCAEIEERSEHNLFHLLIGKEICHTYILKETENFIVMPSIGSFVPGYLTIVPRCHVLSFGHLPVKYDLELQTLLEQMEKWLISRFEMPVIFSNMDRFLSLNVAEVAQIMHIYI
ncbi:MAG: hypothetical protein OMM_07698 [Candidatus Magnetoglobus multicellularis str. Araruama]|uniref:HIT domain-containing protein n=1 Tax=Candidatus Magnetoglobus multicellularis str. Araruama TaxID=890399 RepID=A0A1V1PB43_9BACT|nr:MAG: hypothetical protein OMM_07698 [Candidatus Magnetoglobus multicellularis str. Araruama]